MVSHFHVVTLIFLFGFSKVQFENVLNLLLGLFNQPQLGFLVLVLENLIVDFVLLNFLSYLFMAMKRDIE